MDHLERGVVPGRKVTVEAAAAVVIVPARSRPAARPCGEPHVELVRDGDVIQAIDVTCPCGRRMRLRCDYDEPASPPRPSGERG